VVRTYIPLSPKHNIHVQYSTRTANRRHPTTNFPSLNSHSHTQAYKHTKQHAVRVLLLFPSVQAVVRKRASCCSFSSMPHHTTLGQRNRATTTRDDHADGSDMGFTTRFVRLLGLQTKNNTFHSENLGRGGGVKHVVPLCSND
jgi:hypothetical protein